MANLNEEFSEIAYKVGDTVWYVPDLCGPLLLIKCKILEVYTGFKEAHPLGDILYWLDEPIGRKLGASEFYQTKAKAIKSIMDNENGYTYENIDLSKHRAEKLYSIKMHNPNSDAASFKDSIYPEKIRGIDWFTLDDII